MWNTCYSKHTCTDRGKRRQNETQENQRFSKERAGWSEENIGSSKVALPWRMHVPVMLLRSSYDKLYRNNWRRDPVSGDNSNKQIFNLHIFRGNKQIDYRRVRQLSNLLVCRQGRKSAYYPPVTIYIHSIHLLKQISPKVCMRRRLSQGRHHWSCTRCYHAKNGATHIYERTVTIIQHSTLPCYDLSTVQTVHPPAIHNYYP